MILIIGLGGTGAGLARLLRKQYPDRQLYGIDDDEVEEKNLMRQDFFRDELGQNKVEALLSRELLSGFVIDKFHANFRPVGKIECVFCCADNMLARRETLVWSDYRQIPAILCGNETHAAEAYVYLPDWQGKKKDPRSYYPELKTSNEQAACADSPNPQTVMANSAAATFAAYLFDLYQEIGFDARRVGKRVYHIRINKSDVTCRR